MDALEVLAELRALGYEVTVRTAERVARVSGHEYRYTVAEALKLRGPAEPPERLRRAAAERRRELMALVSLEHPPVAWLRKLLRLHRQGRGAGGGVTAGVVAANLASFVELGPREGGAHLRPSIARGLARLEGRPATPGERGTADSAFEDRALASSAPRKSVRQTERGTARRDGTRTLSAGPGGTYDAQKGRPA